MISEFDLDPHPGRPKILFIGWPATSHTHSWIDLLRDSPFNVRLFCLNPTLPPEDWLVRCYVTSREGPRLDNAWRRSVYPPPPGSSAFRAYLVREMARSGLIADTADFAEAGHAPTGPYAPKPAEQDATTFEEALARVICDWQPDVIHTLGFDPASYIYLQARKRHAIGAIGRWVAQARGGPDIALRRYSPEYLPRIKEVLDSCDHFIADNQQNYDFALSAGLAPSKIENPGMGVVSGPGGLDLKALRARWTLPPSKRERIVVWPKAYEITSSKAMPVFEAILNVWEKIQPCRIEMLWMTQPEVQTWYQKLFPEDVKVHCPTFDRLSRDETLDRIARARVMMAPSLSDGIPNTMMEAMALGAVPLVSPIETIVPVVREGENVLFARNLYPDEIGTALVRLMNDDALVDHIAAQNAVRIYTLANRTRVRERALEFYETVAGRARAERC